MVNYGFHSKNGLFFQRDDRGGVTVRKVSGKRVVWVINLDSHEWASVMTSVCARGEDAIAFQRALEFHMAKE